MAEGTAKKKVAHPAKRTPAKGSPSRARASGGRGGGHTGTVEARIAHIEKMMWTLYGPGAFRTGKTIKELAKKWGLSLDTVKGYSAEASRRVNAVRAETREVVRARCLNSFELALEGALEDRAWRDAAMISKMHLEAEGHAAPSRTELTGADGAPLIPTAKPVATASAANRLIEDAFGSRAANPSPNGTSEPAAESPAVGGGAQGDPVIREEDPGK